MRGTRFDLADVGAAVLPVIAAAVAWWPITATYFHQDDFLNLYELINWPTGEFLARMRGGHLLLTRNLFLLAHHSLFGLRSELYMGAVWVTHLLNVALLYRLVRRMTASRALACFGATLWGVAAVNEGTLNWYSVYGQVLALTAVLLVLLGLLQHEATGERRWPSLLVWSALLATASSSFGTGLGMTQVMPLVALLWLSPSPDRRRIVAVVTATTVAMVGLYLVLHSADIAAHRGVSTFAYLAAARRWWTETLLFLVHLFACGASSLLFSTWYSEDLYPGGLASLVLATAAALTAAGLLRAPATTRRQVLGALLLAAGAYLLIALGRFYTTGRLEYVYRAARYHYAAPAMLAVAFCTAISGLAGVRWLGTSLRLTLLSSWILLETVGYARGARIDHFDEPRREVTQTMDEIAAAARGAPPGTSVYLPLRPFFGVGRVVATILPIFPGTAAIFAVYSATDEIDGRRVFFVAPDAKVYAATRDGRRSSKLIAEPR